MSRQAKEEAVKAFSDMVGRARSGMVAGFTGMNVAAVDEVRAKLREINADYRVVKNTLMKRAINGTRLEGLAERFSGPTAVALKYDDDAGLLGKALKDLKKKFEQLEVKAGFVEEELLEGEGALETMANLPTLDEARSQIMGLLNAPAEKLLATINAPGTQLAGVIKAKSEKEDS